MNSMSMYLLVILVRLASEAAGSSSVQPLCHPDERRALAEFMTYFNLTNFYLGSDCCQWDGVSCDPITGHVIKLDLSSRLLFQTFPSNTTLFQLGWLQHLNLAYNDFSPSQIPSGFGHLSHLTYLNLSNSGFSGPIPVDIGRLSSLTTLDLSVDTYLIKLNMTNLGTIISNLTHLRVLDLSGVEMIDTILPPMIANLSKLTSLNLRGCGLQGELPMTIFSMPELQLLDLGANSLQADFSASAVQWTSPLEVVDLSFCNFTGKLPFSIGDSSNSSLRSINVGGCGFHGHIPTWMWNVTDEIILSGNSFSGSLPATINTHVLPKFTTLDFGSNQITGTIPAWLFTLPSLIFLSLADNLFTGIGQSNALNGSAYSALFEFRANNNQLQGQIPEAIFQLHNLQLLDLSWNNLSTTILLSKFHNLHTLSDLSLTQNHNISFIDDMDTESISSWPSFWRLELSSCNLGQFPIFLRGQKNLQVLYLSNNSIHGHLPEWFLDLKTTELFALDISHNSLTGGLEHLQRLKMETFCPDLFQASNNQFSRESLSYLCRSPCVTAIDLSQNNLTGNIPGCFLSLSSELMTLDLSQNQLEGGLISSAIFEDCSLLEFRLNGNQLEGPIPRSLSNCHYLQFLDLSNNNFNGTFPHWLDVLPELEMLILGSNNLQGSLSNSNTTSSFPSLKYLDISSNGLTGILPDGFLKSFKEMMKLDNMDSSGMTPQYMGQYKVGIHIYRDSINTWFKGFSHRLDAISENLVSIDASRNRLEGSIPEAIGDLLSLRWLNLAQNNFTGSIPPSLSKLSLLESLDLSFNGLDGKIPSELVNLNSLEFFNVSENHLVGPVPTGKQFDTFLDNSYLGNPGLCGELLINKCGKHVKAPNPAAVEGNIDDSSSLNVWEIALMGFGFGMFVASLWGYLVFWESNYYWVVRLIFKIEVLIMLCKRRRRQQIKEIGA